MHFCEKQGNNDPKEVVVFHEEINRELHDHEKIYARAEHFIATFQNPDHKEHKEIVQTHFEKFIKTPTGKKQKKGRGNNKKRRSETNKTLRINYGRSIVA